MENLILHYDTKRDGYLAPNGHSAAREHDTLTPNGNQMPGRWVFRDGFGSLVDFDKYRNDLAGRNNLRNL